MSSHEREEAGMKIWLRLASAGLLALFAIMPAYANEKAEPDPAQSPYWGPIRQLMFGERIISPDAREIIRVYLNVRADDASTSDNPNFRFFFTPEQKAELRIEVEDTHDRKFSHSVTISEGVPLPGG
jgi:hypothetical protein